MHGLKKTLLTSAGVICVVLGFIGIFIPVLPTTPFLLLAAFLFARSSNRAHHWLLTNRWCGSRIKHYHEGRGMTLRDKLIAIVSLWITIGLTVVVFVDNIWVRMLLVGIASAVTFHLLHINTYRPPPKAHQPNKRVESE